MLYIDNFQVIRVRQVNLFIFPALTKVILIGRLLLHNGNWIIRDILVIVFFDLGINNLLILYFLDG